MAIGLQRGKILLKKQLIFIVSSIKTLHTTSYYLLLVDIVRFVDDLYVPVEHSVISLR